MIELRFKNMFARISLCRLSIMAKAVVAVLQFLPICPAYSQAEQVPITCSMQFSDNMVLQRGMKVPVWGWSAPNAEITVAFAGQTKSTRADAKGSWRVVLDPLEASAQNREINIKTDDGQLIIHNVLVGEVWLASGQSNMEWPLKKFKDQGSELPDVDRSLIRMITVKQVASITPLDRIDGAWMALDSKTWQDCSATASYYAANLLKELGVPIGIIQSSWGGALIEPWMPSGSVSLLSEEARKALRFELTQQELDELSKKPWDLHSLGGMYNSMIHPCAGFAMRGVIWYQGESNVGDVFYEQKLTSLITSWRNAWGIGEFPFYFVQLAPHRRSGGERLGRLWEAQLKVARSVPHTGMAVISDSSQVLNIHPSNKPAVGKRLALWALAKDYDRTVVHAGPWYKGFKAEGSRIVIEFDHAESGLAFVGDMITAVSILGEGDQAFVEAKATLEGNKLVVEHPAGKKALHVRMGWSPGDVINLTNKEGLPASPFRTDALP